MLTRPVLTFFLHVSVLAAATNCANAFVSVSIPTVTGLHPRHHCNQEQAFVVTTELAAQRVPPRDASTSTTSTRRQLFSGALGAFVGTTAALTAATVLVAQPQPAEATYSAYTEREKDWEERVKKGEVKITSARSLRKQLQEIVPENNDSRSKVFCPNGTPSNVSPLMENKCSDVLLALPSVYGRTQDAVGNSIPGGFTGGELTSLTAATGGFPKY